MTPARRMSGFTAVAAATMLAAGVVAAPAQASPGAASQALATLKTLWAAKPAAAQAALCRSWTINRSITITSTVQAIRVVPAGAQLTPAETRVVATKYLKWACAGPGGTPR